MLLRTPKSPLWRVREQIANCPDLSRVALSRLHLPGSAESSRNLISCGERVILLSDSMSSLNILYLNVQDQRLFNKQLPIFVNGILYVNKGKPHQIISS